MLKPKIHHAMVTRAGLHYVGSCTAGVGLMEAVDLLEGEAVDIVNTNNGNQLTTYCITGEHGSDIIFINGTVAHLISPDDLVIIVGYGTADDTEVRAYKPDVISVDEGNKTLESGNDLMNVPDGSDLKNPHSPESQS